MKKTIVVLGKVKANKNSTNYVDTVEGRVFLGKTSGFKAGDEISGEAICDPIDITYPATAATGTPGQPNYRAAQPERTEKAWQSQNFITDEQITKQLENSARREKANLGIAIVKRQTAEVATMETAELWAHVG